AKAGRGRGTVQPASVNAGSTACQPKAPRTTAARRVGRSSRSSRTSHGRQVSRSPGVGLLAGGAQWTGEVIRTPWRSRPSSACSDVGWEARPTSYSAWYSTSPERSPVNIRPVRLPPCAAGASPTISRRASGGAEARHRPAPVRPVGEGGPLGAGHLLPPGDQAGAGTTAGDTPVEAGKAGQFGTVRVGGCGRAGRAGR